MTDTKQPEALRLADWCDLGVDPYDNATAAELRRLHEENETLKKCLFQMQNAAIELAKPEQEPIQLLAKGARYKITQLQLIGCVIAGLPEKLNGQWVALVDATDGKHLSYTAPPRKPWVSLSDEDKELLITLHAPPIHPDFSEDDSFDDLLRKHEAKLYELNAAPTAQTGKE